MSVAASQARAQGAALKREFRAFISSAGHGRRTGVCRRQRGTNVLAEDSFGLRFSLARVRKLASSWGHKAKTQAKLLSVRAYRSGPQSRVNSCGTPSRIETIIAQVRCANVHTRSFGRTYHYSSINTERRNSEKSCSNCGNLAPCKSIHFCISLINKSLDFFQSGPPLANHLPPAQVRPYWCPES